MEELTLEQRFALSRARYEVTRMSRPALEKTALRLLKSRMEQQNGVQCTLAKNGIMFKIDSVQNGLPEIISEETFVDLLKQLTTRCQAALMMSVMSTMTLTMMTSRSFKNS